jgi:sugar phosphate permease
MSRVTPTAALDSRSLWRLRVFAATWLAYFAYYFCRKPFFLSKSSLYHDRQWSLDDLGNLGIIYLVAYTLGQFLAGVVGQRVGARRLLLSGMVLSIGASIVFGSTESLWIFSAAMVLNGCGQATGWAAGAGTMAYWFHRGERGTVMGLWATNYQAGGVAANLLAAWVLGRYAYPWAFYSGVVVLALVSVFVYFNQRNRPEDVHLPPIEEPVLDSTPVAAREVSQASTRTTQRTLPVLLNMLIVGAFYFFVKFIRYALWSWVPLLLDLSYGLKKDDAGYMATIFDMGGILGVISAGVISDRLFRGRRARVSFIFILANTAACGLLYLSGATSLSAFAICLGLVGFTLYGPDALMTGAGAIEVGSRQKAVLSVGVINGMGSIGSVAQEIVFKRALKVDSGGHVDPIIIFSFLFGCSVCAALCLVVLLWRNRSGAADI